MIRLQTNIDVLIDGGITFMEASIMIVVEGDKEAVEDIVRNINANAIGQFAAHDLDGFSLHKDIRS